MFACPRVTPYRLRVLQILPPCLIASLYLCNPNRHAALSSITSALSLSLLDKLPAPLRIPILLTSARGFRNSAEFFRGAHLCSFNAF
ncbi:hypothetical protein EV421DRAFT_330413 [Armillaria borealis]|uniref:Uncharacterized protein n=1 Tax=Armillaria borealis TaxID=47425 RepID=A0AA39MT13_9AGAR|nr:hypothetical protein EV421DRAFT_330413 [Armillaria borealis]